MPTYKFCDLPVGSVLTINEPESKYKPTDTELNSIYVKTDHPHRALLELNSGYSLPTIDAERWFMYNKVEGNLQIQIIENKQFFHAT